MQQKKKNHVYSLVQKTAQHDLHGERFVYFIFLTDFKFRFKIGVIGEKTPVLSNSIA